MSQLLKKLSPLIDLLILPAVFLFAPIMWAFRWHNAKNLPMSSKLFEFFGIWPIRRHYYEPLFHNDDLKRPLDGIRDIQIAFNEQSQLALAKEANFSHEIPALNWSEPSESGFNIRNGSFEGGDAEALYNFVRYFKPKTMIEVGSGHSTKIAQQALAKNTGEGHTPSHVCIEPFEQPWLEDLGPQILRRKVEDTGDHIVSSLSENDILFIDSSHVIRPQGDVVFEYLELIPRLKKGVIVHVHDIFTPRDYPLEWVMKEKRIWTEQYLLECLLMNTERYEVQFALNFMKHSHYDALREFCPYLKPGHEPGSLYFRIRS
jgi:hypothetical protein